MNTILVVDDSFLNRVTMMELLQKNIEDLNFLEAENGQEGLKILHEKEIDLVIADLNMPVMDGYELLKKIKSDDTLQDIPVIVNSSITDYEKMAYALSLGARDYFTKTKATQDMGIIISTKVQNILEYSKKVNDIIYLNKMINYDMQISSKIQRNFVKDIVENKNTDIYVKYEPKDMMSGNIMSSVTTGGKTFFLLVDMKASTISSVLLAILFRELFVKRAETAESAARLMEKINDDFIEIIEDDADHVMFSAIIAQFDDNGLTVCNAGFTTVPYILYADGSEAEKVLSSGQMVGVRKNAHYSMVNHKFSEEDCVIFYTEGLFMENTSMDLDLMDSYFQQLCDDSLIDGKFDIKQLTDTLYQEFLDTKVDQKEDITIATIRKSI